MSDEKKSSTEGRLRVLENEGGPVSDLDPVAQFAPDMLEDIFERQKQFMLLLLQADKMPEWPIDITSKWGQRQVKEVNANLVAELFEAMYILKNKAHRFTDATQVDMAAFREELGDALAFFIELCIFSGISPRDLYEEYCRKNAIVRRRAEEGY